MIAVLTGDIVSSTDLSESNYQLIIKNLKTVCSVIEQSYLAEWEIYRGDSFQFYFPKPEYAMAGTVLLKTFLQSLSVEDESVNVTLSLGIGEVSVHSDRLSTSQGSAFTLSGRGLDKTSSGELSIHIENEDLREYLVLPTRFLNQLMSSFSCKQAEALYYYVSLSFPEHQQIADKMQTSRQNISKHLHRIGAELVKEYLLFFEAQVNKANR